MLPVCALIMVRRVYYPGIYCLYKVALMVRNSEPMDWSP